MMPQILSKITDALRAEVRAIREEAETRRPLADYNTVSITEQECLYLRAMTEWLRPRIAVEVGTFIGSSTYSIRAEHVYTCDKSNDCVKSSSRITCFPRRSSTDMLTELVKKGDRVADFFFLDGRLNWDDVELILKLSSPITAYAVDDYERHEKGVINVGMLLPSLKHYAFVPPPQGTKIGLMLPERLL